MFSLFSSSSIVHPRHASPSSSYIYTRSILIELVWFFGLHILFFCTSLSFAMMAEHGQGHLAPLTAASAPVQAEPQQLPTVVCPKPWLLPPLPLSLGHGHDARAA